MPINLHLFGCVGILPLALSQQVPILAVSITTQPQVTMPYITRTAAMALTASTLSYSMEAVSTTLALQTVTCIETTTVRLPTFTIANEFIQVHSCARSDGVAGVSGGKDFEHTMELNPLIHCRTTGVSCTSRGGFSQRENVLLRFSHVQVSMVPSRLKFQITRVRIRRISAYARLIRG